VNAALYHDAVTAGTDLRRALETRGVIERAKGMLVHANGLTVDGAFAALREQSQRTNRKLRDVAVDVTENRIPLDALTSRR
jgi:AmiR/NasT family two-component response regulator